MNNKTKQSCRREYEPDASFYEKVLEAMDTEERKKMTPEKTEKLLQKIRQATMRKRMRATSRKKGAI